MNDYSQLSNYNDLSGLQSLKQASKSDKEGALDAAAKHFESIFVSMMIKSMRDANKVFSEGNLLQSSESDFYQQMFDSQLAVSLSTSKGIGLAEVIKRQLSKDIHQDLPQHVNGLTLDPKTESKKFSLENYSRQPFISTRDVKALETAVEKIDSTLANFSDPLSTPLDKTSTNVDLSSPEKFISSLYPYAKEVESQTGIDARLMLAQSALETGWGQHQIAKQDGSPSFNLFGIKAQASWQGDQAEIVTTEYRQGIALKERASFRAYDSYRDSFQDYANFLKSNERYEAALEHKGDPKTFATELQNSGYATDPKYADKISSIVDRYFDFDNSAYQDDTVKVGD